MRPSQLESPLLCGGWSQATGGGRRLCPAKRSQELCAAIGHQFKVGGGHEEAEPLFLIAPDFLCRACGPTENFVVTLCRGDDFSNCSIELRLVLPAAQAE